MKKNLLITIILSCVFSLLANKIYSQKEIAQKIVEHSKEFAVQTETVNSVNKNECVWIITIDKIYKDFKGIRFSISIILDHNILQQICPTFYFLYESQLFFIQSKNLNDSIISKLGFETVENNTVHLVEKYVPNLENEIVLHDRDYRVIKMKRNRVKVREYKFPPKKLPKSLSIYCTK